MKNQIVQLFMLLIGVCMSSSLAGQSSISGTIKDSFNEPLIGANVIIVGTGTGTVTDLDGNFTLSTPQSPPFDIELSYTGFTDKLLTITNANETLDIVLSEGILLTDQIVVSASRRREKIQEAPASISVLGERQLSVSAQVDPVRNMVNVPGVQIQQQSASKINISMRGQALLFNTDVFPIMDYRSLVGAGVGTFNTLSSGINNIDLERIEVVRGPGSALYGPGVTAGVIHFITKNPIDNPGTTVEVMGGTLSTLGGAFRHAWASDNKKFGYKIGGSYSQGDEFTLDLREDSAQIAKFNFDIYKPTITNGVVDPSEPGTLLYDRSDTDPDGDGNAMQDDWWGLGVNATLEFRPQDDLSVFVSGGVNSSSAVFYNSQGEGLSQGTEFWTQARMQKGGLFAQLFYQGSNGGSDKNPTFLYQTGFSTPVGRQQLEGQLQYNFDVPNFLNANFTVGTDYRNAISDSQNLVYGRNEDDDDFTIIGGYVQGKFALGKKLDLVLAGRYDRFNFLDDGGFSPRAALVFKPHPKHTIRASYNKAISTPTALNLFIDFPVSVPVPGLFDVWLAGVNQEHDYGDNPMIDFTAPGLPDLPYGTPGLPLAVPYGAVNAAVLSQLIPALPEGLQAPVESFLTNPANAPSGVTGNFIAYDLFTRQPYGELVSNPGPSLQNTENLEIGYKGLISDKLSVTVDLYNVKKQGFTLFSAVGPTIRYAIGDIGADLGTAVSANILPFLEQATGSPAAAQQLATAIGGAYSAGGTGFQNAVAPLAAVFGAVESDRAPQGDGLTHSMAGYKVSDNAIDYTGIDVGLEYYLSNNISVFANYSWVSQNAWIPGEEDDDGITFPFYLNSPENKYRIGVLFTPEAGLRGSLSYQHDDSFYGNFGQFRGDTDEVNVIDASVGYDFGNGLSLDVSATNLFDNKYRAFANFPIIGRRVVAKVRYTFGENE